MAVAISGPCTSCCGGVTLQKLLCPSRRIVAMLHFPFLRLGSAGGEERTAWYKDKPLSQADGGSAAAITTEKMTKSTETLRTGGSIIGVTTLCAMSTEFSLAGIRYHTQRLETFARKKFTISNNNVVGGGGSLAQC